MVRYRILGRQKSLDGRTRKQVVLRSRYDANSFRRIEVGRRPKAEARPARRYYELTPVGQASIVEVEARFPTLPRIFETA